MTGRVARRPRTGSPGSIIPSSERAAHVVRAECSTGMRTSLPGKARRRGVDLDA